MSEAPRPYEPIAVLQECVELQTRKAADYQSGVSAIRHADYYPSGVMTILDLLHTKMLRLRSVATAMRDDPTYVRNFESLEDSAKDMINYASFLVALVRGKLDGQKNDRDVFNRPMNEAKRA
jgi:hypothetical protein